MTTYNYDASQVGVPRPLATGIQIVYTAGGAPVVTSDQALVTTMADGSTMQIGNMGAITQQLDLVNHGNDPIQVVDFITGAPITGQTTSLNSIVLQLLAAIRQIQLANN